MVRLYTVRIVVLLSLILGKGISTPAKSYIVRPGNGAPLTKALEKAQDGDTLLIQSGVYKEGAIVLKKGLHLIGENYPVLDGEGKHEILFFEDSNATFKGLLFRNSGQSGFNDIAALKINNAQNVLIEDCKFENNFFAIHTMNSQYVTYLNNHIENKIGKEGTSGNGIHCWKSNHLRIEGNTVIGHRDGIYLEFVTKSIVDNNISRYNKRYGIHFMFSHDDVYQGNRFIDNGSGVAVMYSKRVKMIRNTFAQNWGGASYGILLKEIDDSHVLGNEFRENTIAIFIDGSNRISIEGNDFLQNGWAIRINASSVSSEIIKNNFIGNTFDMATNGHLKVKSLDGNYWDKYEGYDLNRDGIGDIAYHPVSFYSIIIEKNPGALMLFRSFFIKLMDQAESTFPFLTPENVKDNAPALKRLKHKSYDSV